MAALRAIKADTEAILIRHLTDDEDLVRPVALKHQMG
jgi:hypothetical protein